MELLRGEVVHDIGSNAWRLKGIDIVCGVGNDNNVQEWILCK